MDVEDGGDMSAWRATRRLPWKRGDQIHPARPSPFQILTSTTLDTTLTWSCRWCLHLCHLVQSQRIGNLGLPRTHVVCWDHVLGPRGGRRRCPSCCWRHSGPLFQRSSWFAWEWFVFTWALLHELQPPIPPSSGALSGHPALPKTFEIVIAHVFLPCEPASPARQFTMQRDLKLPSFQRHDTDAVLA